LEIDPRVRVLGVEVRRKWATIVDERLKKRGLGARGRVFADDIRLVLPRFVDRSLSVAYVHFPDPWWKKRHHKRLVLNQELLVELNRVLVPGGELLVQTDVFERADEYERVVAENGRFEPVEQTARVADHPYGARSPRERKAMEVGLPVVRLRYRNLGVRS
jgi:tRNA (guanine-N7-)-methyltransferase